MNLKKLIELNNLKLKKTKVKQKKTQKNKRLKYWIIFNKKRDSRGIRKMKKNIISITGDLASGQSTVSKMLAEDLNYYLYRNGAYFRQLAIEKGMSVTEFGEYVEN